MQTVIFCSNSNTSAPSTSASRYITIASSGGNTWESQIAATRMPVPIAGSFKYLTGVFQTAIASGSYRVGMCKNGSTTISGPEFTVQNGAQGGRDTTNSLSISAGDDVSIKSEPTGTPTAQTDGTPVSCVFESSVANESAIFGFFIATTAPTYFLPASVTASTSAETNVSARMPCAGVVDQLYVRVQTAPGAGGDTLTFTINKNGSSTGLTCSIVDGAVTGNDTDTGHAVTFAADDTISLTMTSSGPSPAYSATGWSVRFVPDIIGESIMASRIITFTGGAVTAERYGFVAGGSAASTSVESQVHAIAPIDFVARKLYIKANVSPGSGNTRTWTLRKGTGGGQSDTALTVTLGDELEKENTSDSVSVSANDILTIGTVPTSSPTDSVAIVGSMVAYIAPAAAGGGAGVVGGGVGRAGGMIG